MEEQFWRERWQEGQIGFHQDQFNRYLVDNWPGMQADKAKPVFVPLCGKTRDMLWLQQQGYKVFGVELSEIAVQAFFTENKLEYQLADEYSMKKYFNDDFVLYQGDFFALPDEVFTDMGAVYDRASLIALPPSMREDYAKRMSAICHSGLQVLLVTMEYPQEQMQGPPFCVSAEEVNGLYQSSFEVKALADYDILEANARFKERGIDFLREHVYLLQRK